MGGLRHKMPVTYWTMMVGGLSLTGVGLPLVTLLDTPLGFAGFVSKDMIVEASFAAGTEVGRVAFVLLVASAAMTAFYTWRLMFMTFHGEPKDHHAYEHAQESPNVILIPLYVLAAGAALAGMNWYSDFIGHGEAEFWGPAIFNAEGKEILLAAEEAPKLVKLSPVLAMLFGLGLAYQMYIRRPDWPAKWAAAQPLLYQFLLNKWYFDEIYEVMFVRPAKWIGYQLWQRGDLRTIDGIINGISMGLIPRLTRFAGRVQSGYVFHYAFAILIGVSLLITWFAVTAGGQ